MRGGGVGDDRGFERMYERFHPKILSYCLRRTTFADAHDAAAEVFTTAWRRRKDMPGGESALPWLYGVARKVLGHHRRAAGRRQNLVYKAGGQGAPSPRTPEEVVVEHADLARVRSALALLKETDREILMLSAWEGLSHAAISESLGISLAAVDKRLTRAKRRLTRQFDSQARRDHSMRRRRGEA